MIACCGLEAAAGLLFALPTFGETVSFFLSGLTFDKVDDGGGDIYICRFLDAFQSG